MRKYLTSLLLVIIPFCYSFPQLTQLTELNPGFSNQVRDIVNWDGQIYFLVLDYNCLAEEECELNGLWKSDGTPEGTERIVEGNFRFLRTSNTGLYFTEFYGLSASEHNSNSGLWYSDGTSEGSMNFWSTTAGYEEMILPVIDEITPAGELMYYRVRSDDPSVNGLWITDGSASIQLYNGTVMELEALGFRILFTIEKLEGETMELWVSLGVPSLTFGIIDMPAFDITATEDGAYFRSENELGQHQLYYTNGSEDGTIPQITFADGERLETILAADNWIYLMTSNSSEGFDKLHRFDGVGSTASVLAEFDAFSLVPLKQTVGDDLYFTSFNGTASLWFSDGTEEQTYMVQSFNGLAQYGVFDGGLAFCGVDTEMGAEPWLSDGTAGGTENLVDVIPGPQGSFPEGFTQKDEELYFAAFSPETGVQQLWKWEEEVIVPPTESAVTHFNLINAEMDIPFSNYSNLTANTEIDWSQLWAYKLNVEAVAADGADIGSVVFTMNGEEFKIENNAPYALFGDSPSGDFHFWQPFPKDGESFDICATPYSGPNGSGEAGDPLCLTLSFVNDFALNVTSFTLVDADTDEDLFDLYEGAVIDLAEVGNNLNIRANTQPQQLGSVKFRTNSVRRTENEFPYAAAGDNEGDYHVWNPEIKEYYLRAKAFSRPDGEGYGGAPYSIHFKVFNSAEARLATDNEPVMNIYPVPATDHITINISKLDHSQQSILEIYDLSGRLTESHTVKPSDQQSVKFDLAGYNSGMYSAVLKTGSNIESLKFIVIER